MKTKVITPHDGYEYFFGYYDLQPYDGEEKFHLAHRVAFLDRHPNAADVAEIGVIELATQRFIKLAETHSWNFQQGALLVWFESGKSVLFNDFDGEKHISRVVDMEGNELRRYDYPLGSVSADRTKGLSINFSRIHDFRKGYGYSNIKDPFYEENAPISDGIFLVDLVTGEGRLIASYADMAAAFSEEPFTNGKLVVNHITFNPSGTAFVILLRNFPVNTPKWGTVLAVGDLDGNFKKLTNFQVNSHYSFRGDGLVYIWSGLPEYGVYVFDTKTGERKLLHTPVTDKGDIHVNCSKSGDCFIGDGYVEAGGVRSIYRYDFARERIEKLLSVYSVPVTDTDIRCDLHARFSPSEKYISYDTTENGKREIVQIEL
ncbi:MAG: hypothetical protein IJX81_04655 [Clostridia bacterium]|nr:hypothetical protein [Clostridia bacterium]